MDKYIGRLLDNRYEILEVIGTGGMAVVYKARCHRLNRLVAIKILKDDFLEDEDFRRRFHAESQAVAMLSHPNIVSVYDVSTSISLEADYIVMELIEGITLKQYMEKKGVLNWKETLHFAMQIAKALEHAHSRGIVHRDIKPHNVMVLKNGSVKVADFGIARMMSKGDTLTKEALGSVHYISPEQAKGGRVDNRSDIYSLGVVMYEMMSGRPPYEGESPVAVAIQHINGGAVLPSTLNPNIPGGMEQIIMKSMAKELADRYATATLLLADMDEFRKDPALLFDYNTPPIDDVTKLNKPPLTLTGTGKTTADRVEEKAEGRRKPTPKPAPVPPARRKKQEAEDRGSRIATVAIIVCSLVAVLAISIFLIFLFNGGLSGSGRNMVEVPNLVGKYYDALKEYPGLEIVQSGDGVYDQNFEAGQITDQNPTYGTKVAEGTKIHVTVSLGPTEPVNMPDMTGMTKEQAESTINNLKLGIHIHWTEEYNDAVAAGVVIRTEPAMDVLLTTGQEITVVLSKGKQLTVPKVVGLELDMAMRILTDQGFPTPEHEYVYSEEERGVVVSQSVEKGEKVSSDTVIKLEVSQGPEETTEPETTEPETTVPETTEPPTETPTQAPVTKDVTIDLSAYIPDADTLVQIIRDGEEVYNRTHSLEDTVVTIKNQTGTGTVEYYVFINQGEDAVHVEKVTFTTDG